MVRIPRVLCLMSLGLLLLIQGSSAVLKPESRDLTYIPGQPVAVDVSQMDVGRLTLSGAATFANPTGTPVAEQLLTLKVRADKHYPITWGDHYHPSYGYGLPIITTGGGVIDEWEFRYDAQSQTWGLRRSTQPPPGLVDCPIVVGTMAGQPLTDLAYNKPGICHVRGNGLVVEIHVRVDSGNPSLVPNKQTAGQPPEALVAAPLTMPAGKTSLCVRATEGLGLSGIPCQAGLQNMQVAAGDWSLGLTGKAKGSTRQAVVTLYYLAENL